MKSAGTTKPSLYNSLHDRLTEMAASVTNYHYTPIKPNSNRYTSSQFFVSWSEKKKVGPVPVFERRKTFQVRDSKRKERNYSASRIFGGQNASR
ncbi:hypothetical protein CDAR_617871 [Caerostris darwini]|uniref:Uncharacterized protein n=1 Tax=Caerostris darwini TaxID=1538125 RepID=A0AAV4RQ05_9ARAC|nr:hypothetical protein CDAR_617871 [Caerostris darwini]